MCEYVSYIGNLSDSSSSLLSDLSTTTLAVYSPDQVTSSVNLNKCKNATNVLLQLVSDGFLTTTSTENSIGNNLLNIASNFVVNAASQVQSTTNNFTNQTSSNEAGSFVENFISQIASATSKTMIDGQSPVSILSENIQLTNFKALSVDFTNSTLSPPMSIAALQYKKNTQRIQFSLNPDEALQCQGDSGNGYVSIGILQWNKNPFADSNSLKTKLLRAQTASAASNLLNETTVTINMTISQPKYFITFQFSESLNNSNNIHNHISEKHNVTIPDCKIYDGKNYVPCNNCLLSTHTNHNATFACYDLSQICGSSVSGSGRLLQSSGDDDGGSNNAANVNQFGAIFSALLAEYASVLSANPFQIDINKAKPVLAFLGCFIFISLLGLYQFSQWDRVDAKKIGFGLSKSSIKKKPFSFVDRINLTVFNNKSDDFTYLGTVKKKNMKKKKEAKNEFDTANQFIDSFMPKCSNNNQYGISFVSFLFSICEHHGYFTMFTNASLSNSRSLQWIKLIFSILLNLFVDTSFYYIFFQDNGSCNAYDTQATCISTMNQATARPSCIWLSDPTTEDTAAGSCSIRPPPSSVTFTVMISVITLVIVIPISFVVEYFIDENCSKRPELELIGLSSTYWLYSRISDNKKVGKLTKIKKRDFEAEDFENIVDISVDLSDDFKFDFSEDAAEKRGSIIFHDNVMIHKIKHDDENIKNNYEDENSNLNSRISDDLDFILLQIELLSSKENKEVSSFIASNDNANENAVDKSIVHRKILNQLRDFLKIRVDGSPETLSLFEHWKYGSIRVRMLKKIGSIYSKMAVIEEELESISNENNHIKDIILMQYFLLEQFTTFRKFLLKKHLFVFVDLIPETIHPITWILSWIIVLCSILFFLYWTFNWSVQNAGTMFDSWGLNFGVSIVCDVFFNEVAKVFIYFVLSNQILKPQLNAIHRVFSGIVLQFVANNSFFLTDKNFSSIKTNVMSNNKINEKCKLNNLNNFNPAIQYISPACRVASQENFKFLMSSKILQMFDDNDMQMCKTYAQNYFGFVALLFLAIPVLVGIFNDSLSDLLFDILLPFAFSAIIVFEQFCLQLGPYLFTLSIFFPVWYILSKTYFNSSLERLKKISQKNNENKIKKASTWSSTRRSNRLEIFIFKYIYSLKCFLVFVFDKCIVLFSPNQIKLNIGNDISKKIWLKMNIPLNLQPRIKTKDLINCNSIINQEIKTIENLKSNSYEENQDIIEKYKLLEIAKLHSNDFEHNYFHNDNNNNNNNNNKDNKSSQNNFFNWPFFQTTKTDQNADKNFIFNDSLENKKNDFFVKIDQNDVDTDNKNKNKYLKFVMKEDYFDDHENNNSNFFEEKKSLIESNEAIRIQHRNTLVVSYTNQKMNNVSNNKNTYTEFIKNNNNNILGLNLPIEIVLLQNKLKQKRKKEQFYLFEFVERNFFKNKNIHLNNKVLTENQNSNLKCTLFEVIEEKLKLFTIKKRFLINNLNNFQLKNKTSNIQTAIQKILISYITLKFDKTVNTNKLSSICEKISTLPLEFFFEFEINVSIIELKNSFSVIFEYFLPYGKLLNSNEKNEIDLFFDSWINKNYDYYHENEVNNNTNNNNDNNKNNNKTNKNKKNVQRNIFFDINDDEFVYHDDVNKNVAFSKFCKWFLDDLYEEKLFLLLKY
jgi:hypothetical protein